MSISFGSVLTCLLIIIVLFLYTELILHLDSGMILSKSRIIFLCVILLCLRVVIPFNFPFTITIPIKNELRQINNLLSHRVIYSFKVYNIIWGFWIIGFIYQLVIFVWNYKRHYNLIRQAAIMDHINKEKIVSALSKHTSKRIEIAIIPESISPAICGILQPILILPDFKYSNEELDFIICHELTHYTKHDMVIKLILEICTRFYWWNPFMYLLRDRFYLAVEMANDISIIANKSQTLRFRYMHCLIACSKYCSDNKKTNITTIPFIKDSSNLKLRINKMLKFDRKKPFFLHKILIYFIISILLIGGIIIVPESYYLPPEIASTTISIDKDNSYLVKTKDGYALYTDGKYVITFSEIDESLRALPVYKNIKLGG